MANEFDPEINQREPNSFLQYSRGIDVDTRGDSGAAKFVAGLGDLIGVATRATDSVIRERVTDEGRLEMERARAEFGVDAATDLLGSPPGTKTPEEISRAGTELSGLQQAVRQGKIKESHYQARVESIARQLRAKYIGHRDFIDQMISGMNGSNPANSLRRALASEAEAASSSMSDEAKRWDSFLNSKGWGNLTGEEFARAKAITDPQERARITAQVAQREYDKSNAERRILALNLKDKNRSDFKEDVNTVATESVAGVIDNRFNDALMSFGKTRENLNSIIDGTKNPTPGDVEAFTQVISKAKLNTHDEVNGIIKRFTDNKTPLSTEQIASLRKRVDDFYAPIQDRIANKDFGVAKTWKRDYDAKMENEKLKFVDTNEFNRRKVVVRELLGENNFQYYMNSIPQAQKADIEFTTDYLMNGILSGSYRSLAEANQDAARLSKSSEAAAAAYSKAVGIAANVVTNPAVKDEAVKRAATTIFGPGSIEAFKSLPENTKQSMFKSLANEQVAERLRKVGGDAWKNYVDWTTNGTYIYGAPALNSLSRINSEEGAYFRIVFDPEKMQFQQDSLRTAIRNPQEYANQSGQNHTSYDTARRLNTYLGSLVSIVGKNGDPYPSVARWLATVGVDLNKISTKPIPELNPQGSQGKGRLNLGKNLTDEERNAPVVSLGEAGITIDDRFDRDTIRRSLAEEEEIQAGESKRRAGELIGSEGQPFNELWKKIYPKANKIDDNKALEARDFLQGWNSMSPEEQAEFEKMLNKR
jgi:hypothetical protein